MLKPTTKNPSVKHTSADPQPADRLINESARVPPAGKPLAAQSKHLRKSKVHQPKRQTSFVVILPFLLLDERLYKFRVFF